MPLLLEGAKDKTGKTGARQIGVALNRNKHEKDDMQMKSGGGGQRDGVKV